MSPPSLSRIFVAGLASDFFADLASDVFVEGDAAGVPWDAAFDMEADVAVPFVGGDFVVGDDETAAVVPAEAPGPPPCADGWLAPLVTRPCSYANSARSGIAPIRSSIVREQLSQPLTKL